MAIKGKSAPAAVASMNPDNMVQGGLKDDFDGEILKARFAPWDYEGSIDHDILAVALTIQPDEDDQPFVQHYSAGELESFMPSMDGESPIDPEGEGEALEGVYALRVGKKEQLNNNTNWAHFVRSLIEAGFDKSQLAAEVTFAEGVYGHFNRVPQKKRSGIVTNAAATDKKRSNDILVITELKDKPAKSGKSVAAATRPVAIKPAAKPTPSAPAAAVSNGTNGIDGRLRELITAEVLAAGDEGLAKSTLSQLAIKSFAGADKAKAIKIVNDLAFLNSSTTWAYDADSGLLLSTAG